MAASCVEGLRDLLEDKIEDRSQSELITKGVFVLLFPIPHFDYFVELVTA